MQNDEENFGLELEIKIVTLFRLQLLMPTIRLQVYDDA